MVVLRQVPPQGTGEGAGRCHSSSGDQLQEPSQYLCRACRCPRGAGEQCEGGPAAQGGTCFLLVSCPHGPSLSTQSPLQLAKRLVSSPRRSAQGRVN
ncbi:unnamed protein product [Rangifer tarandus platyrhynchus]|uniref:Uncharacterized protein n=2 Tax=Rangifer tarandus platyrhynchus TaxID=3082113 RepID=A0ABN8YZA7_RANTA|nr:unnamed protein product [Rangifer tarandus platyrhynchus]CAI9705298.1 unnamed protein product [Rangifer tarandus platyrhynchus]